MHPIVAQMRPSSEQLPAVLERGRDIVVTAGAGTGKTRTLVARYLSLLADRVPLRAIVAITFTQKAAREMRNRVRDEMRRYLDRPELAAGEQERWQLLYSELDAARIETIHSLCTEILRGHPAEARVDPRFEVLDEGQTNILRGRALDETLSWAADDPQGAQLFRVLGERGLRKTLDQMMQERLALREAWARTPADLLAFWGRELEARQEAGLGALLASDAWREAVGILQENAAKNPADRLALQQQEVLSALDGEGGPLKERLAALSCLNGIDLRVGGQGSWPGGKEQLKKVKDALRCLRGLWQGKKNPLQLVLTSQDELLAQIIPVLRSAFDYCWQRYELLKEARSALDFDDLEQNALVLLQRNDSVSRRWQREIQAILVDEFQDTNGRQRDLVACLNGGGNKLFIVGDAKQSIYRFRGADVTVFREERDRIGERGGAQFSLDTSYRAHRELIAGLNALLRPVLGTEVDHSRPWVEPFVPLLPYREKAGPGLEAPPIELHLTAGSKGKGALDRAAEALAARIAALVEGGVQVMEGEAARPLEYGDIAILCRASGSFPAYEDALERAGIPFLTVAGRGFYDRPEIRDLLNALQALADPTDDLALVGLLRSPALGLSDAALLLLCEKRSGREAATPLWELLPALELPGEQSSQVQRAARIIGDLNRQVGRISVGELLKRFLDTTTYSAALIQAEHPRAARNVSKLLADAHASNIVGVGEFLEYVTSLRDTGAREGEARSTAEGAVQIMSVHAAKGLEFPVVAIGDITHQRRSRNDPLVDPALGFLLPLQDDDKVQPTAYCLGQERSNDQEAAELQRLFYVAATRAREKLLLSGCLRLNQSGSLGGLAGWLAPIGAGEHLDLAAAAADYDEQGADALELDLEIGGVPVSCTLYEPGLVREARARPSQQKAAGPIPLPPPLLAPVYPGEAVVDRRAAEEERSPPQRVWRVIPPQRRPRAPAWVVGSLVHRALAAWRFPDPAFSRWIEARAREHGITDPSQLADAVQHSRRLLVRFRDHPLFSEMDRAEKRWHEVPYSLMVDGRVESGIIDALYLQGETWTIVEFKTDEVRTPEAFEQLLDQEDYREQAARYIAAARHFLGQRPRFYLCMLNYMAQVWLYPL